MHGSLDLDSDEGEDDFTDNSGNAKLTSGLIDGDFKGIHNQFNHQPSNVKDHHRALINKNDLNRHKPLHRTYHQPNGNYMANVSIDYEDDTDDDDNNVDIGKVIISIGDRVSNNSNNRDNQSSSGSSICDEQLTISSSGSKVNQYRPLPHSYRYYYSHLGQQQQNQQHQQHQQSRLHDDGIHGNENCVIINGVCCNIGSNQELREDYRLSNNHTNTMATTKEGEMDSETSVLLSKEPTERHIKEIDLSNCSTASNNNTTTTTTNHNINNLSDNNSINDNQTNGRPLNHPNQPHTISCRPLSESSSIAQLSIASSLNNDPNAPMCKICHLNAKEMDPLITPCRCAGTMRYIHCGCLMRWLEISSKRTRKPLSCELCQYKYQWHKKFKVRQCQLPHCSKRDKILHSLFFFSVTIMIACAIMTIMCFRHDKGHRIDPNRTELTQSEITTLICGVLFFLAFFLAMYVEVKARNTLYKLLLKFIYLNQQWYIDEYEKKDSRPVDI